MKKITGFFGQELREGDLIAFVARSYSRSYMRVAHIHSIKDDAVKIVYDRPVTVYVWVGDTYTRNSVVKRRISRIYNWRSAVTLGRGDLK